METRNVELKFTYGYWGPFAQDIEAGKEHYDLVMTSETIYAEESVDDLTAVLRAGYKAKEISSVEKVEVGLEESLEDLKLDSWKSKPLAESSETVILVAAKVRHLFLCTAHG